MVTARRRASARLPSHHIDGGEQLDAWKRALGLPSTINIQATISDDAYRYLASLPECGPRGRRIVRLLQRAGTTMVAEERGRP